jgi:hypothetical protein
MKLDLLPFLNYLSWKNNFLTMLCYIMACCCYTIIYFKLRSERTGEFQTRLRQFFGAMALDAALMGFLFHPLFNFWLPNVGRMSIFLATLRLTHFIVKGYIFQKKETP